MPRPPRLVCFDLGGVVLRICRSWSEACAAVGLDVRGDIDGEAAGPPGFRELNHDYQRGRIDEAAFAAGFSGLIDGIYTPAEIVRVHRAWIRGAYDGMDTVVTALHESGLETAILSNTCHEHWLQCEAFDVVRAIPHRHASHLIAACKPDPDAYRAVEETTGRRGGEILFFDDTPENVAAARALGWQAEQIDPHGDPAAQIAFLLEEAGVKPTT